MNLNALELEDEGISDDAKILVFLIVEDLKSQRVASALSLLGCDECYLRPNLSKLVLVQAGFGDQPEAICDFYFRLLEKHGSNMQANYRSIVEQAVLVYKELMSEKGKYSVDT